MGQFLSHLFSNDKNSLEILQRNDSVVYPLNWPQCNFFSEYSYEKQAKQSERDPVFPGMSVLL